MTAHKPLVVLSGLFYPVAMLRYFESALRRRRDIELITTGPDFGAWLPWKSGMRLPYQMPPVDTPLPQTDSGATPLTFAERRIGRVVDLWLQIDAGYYLRGKPKNGVNVVVATDPHCLNYDAQRQSADIFYCMQQPYMKDGDKWLPYAYESNWHRFIENHERTVTCDACLVGIAYKNRSGWARLLRNKGYHVYLETGPAYEDARALYAASLTGFNWSSLQDTTARVYELFAMGVPAVLNRVPDLMDMFTEDKDFLGFDNMREAVRQSIRLIEDVGLRETLRENARDAVELHTYDARVERILKEAGVV